MVIGALEQKKMVMRQTNSFTVKNIGLDVALTCASKTQEKFCTIMTSTNSHIKLLIETRGWMQFSTSMK